MSVRRWKLDIYGRGVTSTTGTISYTLGSSYFRDPPVVGGQIVRAAQCLVESNPWRCTLVDVGSTFTAKLADTSGRLHLLGRLARLRTSLDSTASYTSVTVGRLTDVALAADVASYDLDISDERWIERQTAIFTGVTSFSIVPYGNIAAFQQYPATPAVNWKVIQKTGNMVCLRYDGSLPIPSSPGIAQLIVNDLKPTAVVGNTAITSGNFVSLRFRNTGNATDYEIGAFHFATLDTHWRPVYPVTNVLGWWNEPFLGTDGTRDSVWEKLYVWTVWTASVPALDANIQGYLYAPTHEPTAELPQLVGGSTGLHPFTLVKQIYAGTHSATTTLTVRKSTAAFDRLERDRSYGVCWFRLDSPQNMADFLDSRIYGPYSVAPVVDSSGKVAPARMWLPTSTQLNVAGLATLSSTNLLSHPTWEHPAGEIVNAIRYTYELYGWTGFRIFDTLPPTWGSLTKPTTLGSTRTYDTLSYFGRRQLTFKLGAIGFPFDNDLNNLPFTLVPTLILDKFAISLFQRFGDGPVYSELQCTSSIDATTNGTILPGNFVKVKLATFPNPGIAARGSTRIMQVVRRDVTPLGRGFRLLDVGSNLNPLAAPTLTLALSSQSSRHGIKGTVASLPAGARYECQIARSSSTGAGSPPASSSARWYASVATGTSTGLTWRYGQLASQTRFYGRVKATKANRIGSPWSTANVSVVTASITAPSALTAGSLTAGSALLKWTNGSSLYGVQVMVNATSTITLGSSDVVTLVPPQTTRYTLLGLNSNDGEKAGVRHFDAFGGRSGSATVTFTTTTGYTAAPAINGIIIVNASA